MKNLFYLLLLIYTFSFPENIKGQNTGIGFYPPLTSLCVNYDNDTVPCNIQSIEQLQAISQIIGPNAFVNTPYSDTILFYANNTFNVNINNQLIELEFVSAEITNVSVPDGMIYYCSSDNCMFYPNEWGNIIVSGSPLSPGNYSLDIEANITLNLAPVGVDADVSISFPYDGSNELFNLALGGDYSSINNVIPEFNLNVTGSIYGCTDDNACNYNSEATEDDGSCSFPEIYYDCNGLCVNDIDLDGECDEVDYNDGIGIEEKSLCAPNLITIIDIYGRHQKEGIKGSLLFYIYDNGKIEKKFNH